MAIFRSNLFQVLPSGIFRRNQECSKRFSLQTGARSPCGLSEPVGTLVLPVSQFILMPIAEPCMCVMLMKPTVSVRRLQMSPIYAVSVWSRSLLGSGLMRFTPAMDFFPKMPNLLKHVLLPDWFLLGHRQQRYVPWGTRPPHGQQSPPWMFRWFRGCSKTSSTKNTAETGLIALVIHWCWKLLPVVVAKACARLKNWMSFSLLFVLPKARLWNPLMMMLSTWNVLLNLHDISKSRCSGINMETWFILESVSVRFSVVIRRSWKKRPALLLMMNYVKLWGQPQSRLHVP